MNKGELIDRLEKVKKNLKKVTNRQEGAKFDIDTAKWDVFCQSAKKRLAKSKPIPSVPSAR